MPYPYLHKLKKTKTKTLLQEGNILAKVTQSSDRGESQPSLRVKAPTLPVYISTT